MNDSPDIAGGSGRCPPDVAEETSELSPVGQARPSFRMRSEAFLYCRSPGVGPCSRHVFARVRVVSSLRAPLVMSPLVWSLCHVSCITASRHHALSPLLALCHVDLVMSCLVISFFFRVIYVCSLVLGLRRKLRFVFEMPL